MKTLERNALKSLMGGLSGTYGCGELGGGGDYSAR